MKFFKKDDLSLEQFCEISNAIARHVDNADAEFFGPEDIDDLTSSQMKCLLCSTVKILQSKVLGYQVLGTVMAQQ